MTTPPGFGEGYAQGHDATPTPHDAVGAYVLGVLDPADASAFEAHLAGCGQCAARLDELSGMEPMLARLAEAGPPLDRPVPAPVPPPVAEPPALDRLLKEVTVTHARRRKRTRYMLAAAVAMIIAGPAVAVATMSGGSDTRGNQAGEPLPPSPAENAFRGMTDKLTATDGTTKVSAAVGLEKKSWGTDAVLELKNVKGPLKCNLVAVSKTGEEEVVTSWAVPAWGYGIEDSPNEMAKKPLYVHGGAAMDRGDIDHFEVRTFDGDRLVRLPANA